MITIFAYSGTVTDDSLVLADWTPEQIADGKRWVRTWRLAGIELERIRRRELREKDNYQVIQRLLTDYDYTKSPGAPKPWSGLIEQQRLFMKLAGRDAQSSQEKDSPVPD